MLTIEVTNTQDCIELYFAWHPHIDSIANAINHWLQLMKVEDLVICGNEVYFMNKYRYLVFRNYVNELNDVLDHSKVSISWNGCDGLLPHETLDYLSVRPEQQRFD